MSAPPLRKGEALGLCRQVVNRLEPFDLYAALSDGGQRPDTFLIERSVGPSLVMDAAALRIEARGQEALLFACSPGGRNLMEAIADGLAAFVAERCDDRLRLRFERPAGNDPEARMKTPSPFSVLRLLSGAILYDSQFEPFTLSCLGVIAFDHIDLLEDLPQAENDPLVFPDFVFWVAESLILFEPGAGPRAICTAFGSDDKAAAGRAYFSASQRLSDLVTRCEKARPQPEPAARANRSPSFESDLDDAAYAQVVRAMKQQIAKGEVYQIVPSRTFRGGCADPLAAFARLKRLDPSPYHFFVAAPDMHLFGASPETSVRLFREEGEKKVEVKPIAGTRPRAACADEDDRLEAEMRTDVKEMAEHMMLVDLARNDVARVSRSGTRRVAKLLTVERYARVMHLVSSVTGVLRDGHDAVDALQACLNVGTLTGAPKIRATQLLRETEKTKRGPYGGAIGWINGDGLLDTAVVIRSAVVKDGTAFVRAGAGVVHDSDPLMEAEETKRKASAILSVLDAEGQKA